MTSPRGLRRFVRPDQPGPAGRPGGPDSPGLDHEHGRERGHEPGETSAQSAADLLPPLVAQLLEGAPPEAASVPVAGRVPGARAESAASDAEKCELCATEIPAGHGHVADLESASLVCACRACYLLFTQPTAGRGRYRAVPDRYLSDPGPPLSAGEWDRLEIPVSLAFFFRSSAADRVAGFYPSPAGVTECVLDLGSWDQLSADHPLLGAPAADVEAALICRTDGGIESFVVPIDACYELAGRMRLYWRGFDGGAEARASIADFLDMVRSRARPFRTETESG
jgi:Family of unknown function (DUF5947)